MKVEKRDGGVERRIAIGLITCDLFLARVAPRWLPEGMFRSSWIDVIGKWCVEYQKKYGKAPGKGIQAIYESWAEDSTDQASIEGIGELLGSISGEYAKLKKEANPDHLADMAAQHFDTVQAERRIEKAQQWLAAGQTARAIEIMNGTKGIAFGSQQWIDPYRDTVAIDNTFDRKSDPLITFDGALGEFFMDSLEREGLVAVQGQSKRKKSWVIQELGHQALLQGRKVAMFQVGDLSQDDIMSRLVIRAAKRPYEKGKAKIPTRMIRMRNELHVDYKEKEWTAPLTKERAHAAMLKLAGEGDECRYRLEVHPNISISVVGIMERLLEWDRDGWTPDVCLIDYADILAPVSKKVDGRDSINETWQWMRRLSQERHCLVVTGTQADTASFETDLQRRGNFSNDRRKLDHVSGMFALNMTDKELGEQRMRLNWLERRKRAFTETKVVHVIGCLDVANPWMASSW